MRPPAVHLFFALSAVACGSSDVSDPSGVDSSTPGYPLGVGPYRVATLDLTVAHTVNTTVDHSNGCGIDDWDRLLVEILPPATGVTSDTPADSPSAGSMAVGELGSEPDDSASLISVDPVRT